MDRRVDADGADSLRYDDRGLVPVVAQDVDTGAVLMLAWADREAVEKTVESGWAHFWSRSRGRLWRKGELSGHGLKVVAVMHDCDADALLYRVRPEGPTCHTGSRSCFEPNPAVLELGWLAEVIASRRGSPEAESYTARLLAEGPVRIAQKVGEEGVETALAGVAGTEDELVSEAADLLYHLLVLLAVKGVDPGALARELGRRHREATP